MLCFNFVRFCVRISCFIFLMSFVECVVCKNCYLLVYFDFFKVFLLKINFVIVLILLEVRLYRKFFVGVKDLNKDKKEIWWKIGVIC